MGTGHAETGPASQASVPLMANAMSQGPRNETMLRVRQTCALVVGVILCACIFIPLSGLVSVRLWLWLRSAFLLEHPALAVLTEPLFQAIACCVSGFLTGLIVGFLSADRETRTAMLASLLVIALYAFEIGLTPYLAGELNRWSVYGVFGQVVGAMCLVAFAIWGAWLLARKRRRSGPSWGQVASGTNQQGQPGIATGSEATSST
jgi:hypothetical protein